MRRRLKTWLPAAIALGIVSCQGSPSAPPTARRPLCERLLPAPKDGGFRMKDYYVWCGSLIPAEGKYHLFASRWPKPTGFPDGYRTHSTIVRAVADRPEGPFAFAQEAIGPREGNFWDGRVAHNPKIIRFGSQFVLFYIGSDDKGQMGKRYIGYAVAARIDGPWRRSGRAIPNLWRSKEAHRADATNPAPCVRPDGTLLLGFRQAPEMLIGVAAAPALDGPWTVLNRDVWRSLPEKPDWRRFEDPDVAHVNDRYELIVEDNDTKRPLSGFGHGIHFCSDDGAAWRLCDPPVAYTNTIAWDDGTSTTVYRRERPQMVVQDGRLTHLVTAVKDDASQDESRIVIQPVAPQ
jgi:hypothetical protein